MNQIQLTSSHLETVQALVAESRQLSQIDELNSQNAVDFVRLYDESIRGLESARKTAVEPAVSEQKRINALAKQLSGPLESERLRINRLLGDYAAAEDARLRAIEAQKIAEVTPSDSEMADAIAKTTTVEEVDALREDRDRKIAAAQVLFAQERDTTVKVKPVWEYTVDNIGALYRSHPEAVKMEPKHSVITTLLDGLKGVLPGVTAKQVMEARVRK